MKVGGTSQLLRCVYNGYRQLTLTKSAYVEIAKKQ